MGHRFFKTTFRFQTQNHFDFDLPKKKIKSSFSFSLPFVQLLLLQWLGWTGKRGQPYERRLSSNALRLWVPTVTGLNSLLYLSPPLILVLFSLTLLKLNSNMTTSRVLSHTTPQLNSSPQPVATPQLDSSQVLTEVVRVSWGCTVRRTCWC